MFSSEPVAHDDPNEDRNDRQHDQKVDEPTPKVEGEAEQPHHGEKNCDNP
jgi:hypothetical protein